MMVSIGNRSIHIDTARRYVLIEIPMSEDKRLRVLSRSNNLDSIRNLREKTYYTHNTTIYDTVKSRHVEPLR